LFAGFALNFLKNSAVWALLGSKFIQPGRDKHHYLCLQYAIFFNFLAIFYHIGREFKCGKIPPKTIQGMLLAGVRNYRLLWRQLTTESRTGIYQLNNNNNISSVEGKKNETKDQNKPLQEQPPGEVDGPAGPEPTRFGDWEKKGRVSDF
jgi:hypothetical protein